MVIRAKYAHTNLIARDWRRLARFYVDVLGCVPKLPERNIRGKQLDELTALEGAHLAGIHLRLPGLGEDGPTLELFSYDEMLEASLPAVNRPGFAHIAFQVDDVDTALEAVLAAGGSTVGGPTTFEISEAGTVRVVYARDPEGNILELQQWRAGML